MSPKLKRLSGKRVIVLCQATKSHCRRAKTNADNPSARGIGCWHASSHLQASEQIHNRSGAKSNIRIGFGLERPSSKEFILNQRDQMACLLESSG